MVIFKLLIALRRSKLIEVDRTLTFLNSFIDVSEVTYEKLQDISTYRKLEKNTAIAREGEIPTKVFMLLSGIMRAYVNSESGKQHNKGIFAPVSFVGALTSMIKKAPSKLSYETLTDCKVFEIDFVKFRHLCNTDVNVAKLYIKILEGIYMKYERRSLELMALNATQRYLKLKKQIPNIDDLIPQFQIASYLNVTPVQLSRIRKNLN